MGDTPVMYGEECGPGGGEADCEHASAEWFITSIDENL